MKKILIICLSTNESNGGAQCINRNIDSITEIYGIQNVSIIRIAGNIVKGIGGLFSRLCGIFNGYYGGLDVNQEQNIIKYIKENNQIDTVYIDGSFYGKLAKTIKYRFPEIRVYTFFHNCEFEYSINLLFSKKRYHSFYNILLAHYNEKIACKYSDTIIVLNNRDKGALIKHYHRDADYVIPITFKQWYKPQNCDKTISKPLEALFVGSYFYGNTVGLKWFCRDILPYVDIHFTIVGSGMDKLTSDISLSEKLEVHGKVADLREYYEKADFVILPILSGGGMKVKTAESLMFGKYIIGTPEAFTGYEVNSSCAVICSTAQDFIDSINSLTLKTKFNRPSRDLFESKYSYHNSLRIFKNLFSEYETE